MAVRPLFAALLVAYPVAASAQAGRGVLDWLNKEIIDRVKVTGFRRLSYHSHTVEGDKDAYDVTSYGGQGDERFTDFGQVRVEGRKVLGAIDFDFQIQDSRFRDPQGEKFNVDFKRGPWEIGWGDIRGRLTNTNRFAQMNKTLRGTSVGYRSGPIEIRALRSEVRGQPRTVTISGNNTSGPYFLQSNQIVRGTEQIEVDGVRQVHGQDYTIDYDLGSITFVNRQTLQSKIVPPTSTIVATYESFSFFGSKGTVEGMGVTWSQKGVRLGVSGMRQITGASSRLSTRLEQFQGFGAAGTPYFLQFLPLEGAQVLIRVDGVLQIEDVDYRFDDDNPSIFFFNRFMPSTSNIDVLYTPVPINSVDGDRENVAFDVQVPVRLKGGAGTLTYSQALGRTTNTATPISGTARGVDLRYRAGAMTLSAGFRDIPQDYVSVESIGFQRNERASDIRIGFEPSTALNYGLTHTNSRIVTRSQQANGNVVYSAARFTTLEGNYRLNAPGQLPLNLSHRRTRSDRSGLESQSDRTELSTSKAIGKLATRLEVAHETGAADVAAGNRRTVTLDSVSLRADYRAGSAWSFDAGLGLNSIRSSVGNGQGRDISLGALFRPNDSFLSRLTYTDGNSGKLSDLGVDFGFGLGYNGNGFSSGAGQGFGTSATNGRTLTWSSTWSPFQRLSLSGSASRMRTTGGVSSNSETETYSFGVNWDLGAGHTLTGFATSSSTKFVGSPLRSQATSLQGYLDGTFWDRLTYRLGGSMLLSGGSSEFSQDNFGFEAFLSYRLAPRHALSMLFESGTSTGYQPQGSNDFSLTYQYQIWRNLAFNASYRIRDVRNNDPLSTSGQFKSRGFDLELAFNFGM